MGQASTTAEQIDSQVYVDKPEVFLSKLGVNANEWTAVPSMFPQFNVIVNADKVQEFKSKLEKIVVGGVETTFRLQDNGFFAIDFGQKNVSNAVAIVDGKEVPFKELGLHNLIIEDKADSTAYHIPEGICLVYDPQQAATTQEVKTVSSTAIVPNILKNFNIPLPSYMSYVNMDGIS